MVNNIFYFKKREMRVERDGGDEYFKKKHAIYICIYILSILYATKYLYQFATISLYQYQ